MTTDLTAETPLRPGAADDTKTKPLVSIGIPTYNRPDGLRRTLESVTRQTYCNLEIIVSDNCSSDPGVERTVEEFRRRDERIRYFRQMENTGANNNFTFVLGQATGECFMWVADDDFISEDFVRQAVRFFEEHSGYVIVSGIPFSVTPLGEYRANNGHSFTARFGVLRVLQTYNATGMVVFYGLIDRAALRRIGMQNRFAEDRYVVASLAYMGKIKTLETIRLYRGTGGISSGGSISESHRRMMEAVGAPYRGVALARLTMAGNASKDVFTQKEVYRGLRFPAKVLLALCCFVVTIHNSAVRFYFRPYARRIRRSSIRVASGLLTRFRQTRLG